MDIVGIGFGVILASCALFLLWKLFSTDDESGWKYGAPWSADVPLQPSACDAEQKRQARPRSAHPRTRASLARLKLHQRAASRRRALSRTASRLRHISWTETSVSRETPQGGGPAA